MDAGNRPWGTTARGDATVKSRDALSCTLVPHHARGRVGSRSVTSTDVGMVRHSAAVTGLMDGSGMMTLMTLMTLMTPSLAPRLLQRQRSCMMHQHEVRRSEGIGYNR